MLRNFMVVSKKSLSSFHGPLVITLPPSTPTTQHLAKQHNLSARGWPIPLGTTDALCCDPDVDGQKVYSVAVPSSNGVQGFQNVAKKFVRGRQLTCPLVLPVTFLTRVAGSGKGAQPDLEPTRHAVGFRCEEEILWGQPLRSNP